MKTNINAFSREELIELSDKIVRIDGFNELKSKLKAGRARASAITTGSCFGGITEIIMRADNGRFLYVQLMPGEVVELLYQIAGGIGVNISLSPRRDFAVYRNYKYSDEEIKNAAGHAPPPSDIQKTELSKIGRRKSSQNNITKGT